MDTGKRRIVLAAALLATLVAVWQMSGKPEEPPAPRGRSGAGAETAARGSARADFPQAPPSIPGPQQLAREAFGPGGNAFPSKSWQPPPPPAPAAAPPKPAAPPLPFTYVGKLIEGEQTRVFLADGGGRQLSAKPGDTLDGNYRLDAVTDDRLEFTYLPLKQKQTLTIGRAP